MADSVEKLLFGSYSKNSRAAEASLLLGCGGPCNLLLRATRTVLTSAATIRRVNCREQRTLTRIRSMCILEFFNGIGHKRSFIAPEDQVSLVALHCPRRLHLGQRTEYETSPFLFTCRRGGAGIAPWIARVRGAVRWLRCPKCASRWVGDLNQQ